MYVSTILYETLPTRIRQFLDLPLPPNLRPVLSKALVRLCRASMLHPTCFPLPGLERVGQQVAGGGFGDICKGLVGGKYVAVKIMRVFGDVDVAAAEKELGREAAIWRQLSHPNLLPFLGVYRLENAPDNHLDNTLYRRLDTRLCLVSPWMENGDIPHFLSNTQADIDHVSLLLDIAIGLEYLHMNGVVHGDLKGANIFITPSGRACIADFGFSSISQTVSLQFTHSTRTVWGGSPRYQAPELLSYKNPTRNHAGSDVYAFACLGYEIYTGKNPFFEVSDDMAVTFGVLEGNRPSNDPMIPEAIWKLFQDCWEQDAEKRPTAHQITKRLLSPSIGASQIQTPADWDETFSSRFRRSVLPGAFSLRPQHHALARKE
ncbi:kinase-like domain-containing protein [Mycena leptocephala]|nr:kinase-like domain-containing protein [Mycena leptocephala]